MKKINANDFAFDDDFEDDVFVEVSGGAGKDARGISGFTVGSTCDWASVAVSLSSLLSASEPSNSYSEIDCC